MALYKVIVPFDEGAPAGRAPGARAAPTRYTTIEVEADSAPEAKRLALSEFEEMVRLGRPGATPSKGATVRVIEGDIRAERAPVSRRASLDVATTTIGPEVASARLVGSITSGNFRVLQECLDELEKQGIARLVLDLGGLTYVNSTGLSLFVAAGDVFDLRLASVPARIMRLLRMIGLDKIFPAYKTVSEAAAAPAGTPGAGEAQSEGPITWGPVA